mgnify:CR=1 FL=1
MLVPWLAGHAHAGTLWAVLFLAFLANLALGDPARRFRRLPHPTVLVGRAIAAGDRRFNRPTDAARVRRAKGAALAAAIVLASAAAGLVLTRLLRFPGGAFVEALVAGTLLSHCGLYIAVRRVAVALGEGLAPARDAVCALVSRDPRMLDASGVARAAAESAAENFADGVVVPALWYLLLGLPGLCAYKAVNTLDSMIGYRTPRHRDFGRAAARLDDLANWPGARLAALVIAAGAGLVPGARPGRALAVAWTQANRHRSVNAGWPEGALAGALGFRLAGPRSYAGTAVPDTWIGDGRSDLTPADLRRVLSLFAASTGVLAAAVGLGALALL